MLSLALTVLIAINFCAGPMRRKTEISQRSNRALLPHLLRILVDNGEQQKSFLLNPEATTAELYRKAEATGIMDPIKLEFLTQVIWDPDQTERRIIPDHPSIKLLSILEPSILPNLVRPRQLSLSVFAMEQIAIVVRITNGNVTKSFMANARTRTSEIYQRAVHIGIMDNFYQFLLRCQHDTNRMLIHDSNSSNSIHPPTIMDCMNPRNPNELRLIVSPFPDGVLLFAMFRYMSPNQNIPSWSWADFCARNPWHVLCSSLSRRIEYEDNVDYTDVAISNSLNLVPMNQVEDWANDIYVVNVPTWSGVIHLEHIPRSVRCMNVKGHSVSVDLRALRFSSLRELTLNFEEVIGFDITALSGSPLEVLKLPSHRKLDEKEVDYIIDMLSMMRKMKKIRLETIVFGGKTEQQIIWYSSKLKDYDYIHIHVHR